jgi:hypothetical protein
VSARERIKTRRMHTIELVTPAQAPYRDQPRSDPRHFTGDFDLHADQLLPDARPTVAAGRDSAVVLDYWPIWPFMLLVAVAVLAFAPLFAVVALAALAGAVVAAPFLLIRHFLTRG